MTFLITAAPGDTLTLNRRNRAIKSEITAIYIYIDSHEHFSENIMEN